MYRSLSDADIPLHKCAPVKMGLPTYLYKLAHVQVVINCRFSVAQMCSCEDGLAYILGALSIDDVMNSLTTKSSNFRTLENWNYLNTGLFSVCNLNGILVHLITWISPPSESGLVFRCQLKTGPTMIQYLRNCSILDQKSTN